MQVMTSPVAPFPPTQHTPVFGNDAQCASPGPRAGYSRFFETSPDCLLIITFPSLISHFVRGIQQRDTKSCRRYYFKLLKFGVRVSYHLASILALRRRRGKKRAKSKAGKKKEREREMHDVGKGANQTTCCIEAMEGNSPNDLTCGDPAIHLSAPKWGNICK